MRSASTTQKLAALVLVALLVGCQGEDPAASEVAAVPGRAGATPESNAMLARLEALRAAGRSREALTIAADYLARHPSAPRVNYGLGVLHGTLDDHQAAMASFRAELALDADHFGSHEGIAAAAMRIGDFETALRHLERSLALQPEDDEVGFQLGRMLSALARFDEAEPYLARAAAARDDAASWAEYGLLSRRLGKTDEAISAFKRALARDLADRVALLNLGQLIARRGRPGDLALGQALLERHRAAVASFDRLDQAERSSRVAGATPANFLGLARIHTERGDLERAAAAYRRALAMAPELHVASAGLADVLLRQGDAAAATPLAVAVLMARPNDTDAAVLLARVRIAKGLFEEASALLDSTGAHRVLREKHHVALIADLLRKGATVQAHQWLRAVPAEVAAKPAMLRVRGELALLTSDWTAARSLFASLAEARPDDAEVAFLLGVSAFLGTDAEQSHPAWSRARELFAAELFVAGPDAIVDRFPRIATASLRDAWRRAAGEYPSDSLS